MQQQNGSLCKCQLGDECEQVGCFVRHYERFQARRHSPLSSSQRSGLRKITRISELNLGQVDCVDTSDELATSLILQSFIDAYCEQHPNFTRLVPASNFASKIDFFKNL